MPPRRAPRASRRSSASTRRPRCSASAGCGSRKNLGGAQLVQAPSTAAAVREALTDPQGAAIASRLASDLYGLAGHARAHPGPRPRTSPASSSSSHEDAARTGDDKTTVAFSVRDGRGALMRALAVFDEEGINLSRIESRPSREKSWDYVFLADLVGHREDANVARALERASRELPDGQTPGELPRGHGARPEHARPSLLAPRQHGFRSHPHRRRRRHRPRHRGRPLRSAGTRTTSCSRRTPRSAAGARP